MRPGEQSWTTLQVSGPGSEGGSSEEVDGVGFSDDYSEGISTIKIRDYTLKLSNNGAKLTFGKQTFDLSKEKKIIAINPKGVARVIKRIDEQNDK